METSSINPPGLRCGLMDEGKKSLTSFLEQKNHILRNRYHKLPKAAKGTSLSTGTLLLPEFESLAVFWRKKKSDVSVAINAHRWPTPSAAQLSIFGNFPSTCRMADRSRPTGF